jgi:tetratricopeptide (TPR) repeat protein
MIRRLIVALLLTVGTFAHADPKAEEARQHYEAGKKFYRLGDVDKAIDEWKAGYLAKDDPGFLFNIAQAYRDKGEAALAIKFYQNYLKEAPNASNRDIAEQHIAELQQSLGHTAPATEPVKPPEPGIKPPEPIKPPDQHPPPPPPPPPPPSTSAPAEKSSSLRTIGYIVGGAGVALAVTGVIFGATAKSDQSAVEDAVAQGKTWDQALADKDSAGRTAGTIAVFGLVTGGAAIAAGVVLIVVGKPHAAERGVAILPSVGPRGASLTAVVRF